MRKPAPKAVVAALVATVVLIWLVALVGGGIGPFSKIRQLWRYRQQGSLLTSAVDGQGNSYLLYTAKAAGQIASPQELVKLNEHGRRLWRVELPEPEGREYWESLLVAADGRAFVGARFAPRLASLGSDGELAWQTRLELEGEAGVRLLRLTEAGQLVVDCGPAVVPGYASWLDQGDGHLLHKSEMVGGGTYSPPAVGPDGAFYYRRAEDLLFDGDVQLHPGSKRRFAVSLDPQGQEHWVHEGAYHAGFSQFVVGPDGNLYAPRTGGIDVLDPSGKLSWTIGGQSGVLPVLYFAKQVAFVVEDSRLLAVNTISRQLLWSHSVTGGIRDFLPSGDGRLYCLVERPAPASMFDTLRQRMKPTVTGRVYRDLLVLDQSGKLLFKQPGTDIRRLLHAGAGGTVLVASEFEVRALAD
jgi:outer membrane protein assembly factor BamB